MVCGLCVYVEFEHLFLHTVQSSTEVSTVADDYSSTVSVSDKAVPSAESTSANQKVSDSDIHQPGSWPRAEDEATSSRNANPNKPHLISDVDSEGIRACIYRLIAL